MRIKALIFIFICTSTASFAAVESVNVMKLQETRKMGVGTVFSGATGHLGAHMQLNVGSDFSFGLGYGGSTDMKAFTTYFRHLLTNQTLSFYWTAGYARWWSEGGKSLSSTTPDYLYERFLSPSEKLSGKFVEHIVYPGIGAQFYNLSGEYEGLSFYSEVLLMTDIEDLRFSPALGLGAFFYF